MGMIKLPDRAINFFKNNLDEIFNSGNLAEGPWNKKLSKLVKELTGANTALPTNSNGAGVVALLTIYRHYFERKNVLIQSNTMYGVKTMVYASGCSLRGFIQCQLETLMPSILDIKNAISLLDRKEKNKLVIILSHIGGIINPDIEKIAKLCNNENIILIEDCAHSFGATLDHKHSGLFGDAGIYSFYATKAIPAGEGGIIITRDDEIGEMASIYSIYDRFDQKLEIGNNIRISEMQALLIYSIIKEYKTIIRNKIEIAKRYINACNEIGIKYIQQDKNGHFGNYYKFILYNSDLKVGEAFPNLKTKTSSVYDYSIGTLNSVENNHVCLPIWYGLESEIVDRVITELK